MLTDVQIRTAKPKDKPYKLSDALGLHLLVNPSGSKLWQLRYRFEDRERLTGLGPYPELSLAEAREKRDSLKKMIRSGLDPIETKRAEKQARRIARENTFQSAAKAWFEIWSVNKSTRHAGYVMRRLEQDVLPAIGRIPVSEIGTPDIVTMLKKIADRGALDIAKRAHQTVSQIFRCSIAHGLCTRNPAADIRPGDILASRKVKNFARVDERELPDLLRHVEAYQGAPITRLAIKLLLLTFVRTKELIGARWEEFDFNTRQWRIPGERMKMGTPHIVPLSHQAIEILKVLQTITGGRGLLFPGERNRNVPMSNNTILKALERMGYKGRMTGHGFRGLASTILHERGFDHMHIELQLAHQERNRVSASYNHALHIPQRTELMQEWAVYLDRCLGRNVLSIDSEKRLAG